MKVGSYIECIKDFTLRIVILSGGTAPKKGEKFICEDLERCACNLHDNIKINTSIFWWPAQYFREIEPPLNINELLEEVKEQEMILI